MSYFMPMVIEKTERGERAMDLPSKLLESRIILIDSEVTDQLAHVVSAQLLYLDSVSDRDIIMYINSPGGSVHAGLKIADTMEMCRSDVSTICTGYGASMGCFLTSMGTKGKRFLTRRAYLMAHQVSSGTQGHVQDQIASLEHSKELNTLLMGEMADAVGVTYDQIMKDCNRDYWMNAETARDYGKHGFVDGVFTGKRNEQGQHEVLYRKNKVGYL